MEIIALVFAGVCFLGLIAFFAYELGNINGWHEGFDDAEDIWKPKHLR